MRRQVLCCFCSRQYKCLVSFASRVHQPRQQQRRLYGDVGICSPNHRSHLLRDVAGNLAKGTLRVWLGICSSSEGVGGCPYSTSSDVAVNVRTYIRSIVDVLQIPRPHRRGGEHTPQPLRHDRRCQATIAEYL